LDTPNVHSFVSQVPLLLSKQSAQLTQVKRAWGISASLTAVSSSEGAGAERDPSTWARAGMPAVVLRLGQQCPLRSPLLDVAATRKEAACFYEVQNLLSQPTQQLCLRGDPQSQACCTAMQPFRDNQCPCSAWTAFLLHSPSQRQNLRDLYAFCSW
jgi:hypothetical protein